TALERMVLGIGPSCQSHRRTLRSHRRRESTLILQEDFASAYVPTIIGPPSFTPHCRLQQGPRDLKERRGRRQAYCWRTKSIPSIRPPPRLRPVTLSSLPRRNFTSGESQRQGR